MRPHPYRARLVTNSKDRCEGGTSVDGLRIHSACFIPGTAREGAKHAAPEAPCDECGASRRHPLHLLREAGRAPGLSRAQAAIDRWNDAH